MAHDDERFLDGRITLKSGDSRDVLKTLPDNSIDSIVTDPPYALVSIVKRFGGKNAAAVKVPDGGSGAYARASSGFMGKQWDTGDAAFAVEFWEQCLRVLKPGGHVVAFGGTRTYHRLACAIEDAGFEIRDQLAWAYGSGFPKSHDVSKGIDKAAGAERERYFRPAFGGTFSDDNGTTYGTAISNEPSSDAAREWQGWGTALKPAWETICLARKPLSEKTVAANVLRWGTGAINIDGCRVEHQTVNGGNLADNPHLREEHKSHSHFMQSGGGRENYNPAINGRWPANLCHDGSDEVLAAFPDSGPARVGNRGLDTGIQGGKFAAGNRADAWIDKISGHDDAGGSAARFFYTAKADADDRLGSKHPTVKPVDLMQWLCRLVTPKGGTVLDPFAGTGTTGEAAFREGFNAVLIEREEEYQSDIRRRMALCMAGPDERARESIKAKTKDKPINSGPLFSTQEAMI